MGKGNKFRVAVQTPKVFKTFGVFQNIPETSFPTHPEKAFWLFLRDESSHFNIPVLRAARKCARCCRPRRGQEIPRLMFFNLHTHHFSNDPEILELVNQYPDEFNASLPQYSIGIHPWRIHPDRLELDLEIVANKASEKQCLAVGECGLDKRIETPLEEQIPVFERQLLLAEKYRKPVVIHCVAAYQETIDIKKKLGISVPMVIHGFSKNAQVAQSLLGNGFYLSFGKYLLRNPDLEPVFKLVPDDRFFLETDMIDETIQQVYALAAQYKNVALQPMQQIIQRNLQTVFKLDLSSTGN